jgi:Kef-type K+ transport system membrane component KefB
MTRAGDFVQGLATYAIVVIAASVLGQYLKKLTLPLITGYLLTGVIAGPFVLDIIHTGYLADLKWINEFALAIIAFCAGAELYFPDIKKLFMIIMLHVSMITVFTMTFVPLAVLAISSQIPFLKDLPMSCVVPIAFLCGSLMLERSPSGALAMINEMMSQGPITKTLLGVTIVSDVALLTTFAITSSFAEAACGTEGFNSYTLVSTLVTLLLCVVVGYLLGQFIIFIMWIPKLNVYIRGALILPLGYTVFYTSKLVTHASEEHTPLTLSLEPILCCVIASGVAGNATSNRRQFANILHKTAPYIFVPFFALSGANMDLLAMWKGLPFALVLVVSRVLAIMAATYLGGKYLAKESPIHYKFLWMTLLPQAGPLLGLVNEIKEYGPWARELAACCIAALIINHVVGLKLFKWALVIVGEAFKAVPNLLHKDGHEISDEDIKEDEKDKDRTLEIRLFGLNNLSISVAAKLAPSKFSVEMVGSKLTDQKAAREIFEKKKKELIEIHGSELQMNLCNQVLDQYLLRRVWADNFGDDDEEEENKEAKKEFTPSFQTVSTLFDYIAPVGCHALVFMYPDDRINYMCCKLLKHSRNPGDFKKIIAVVRDPTMAQKFEKLGVIPVYALSVLADILSQVSSKDAEAGFSFPPTPSDWVKLVSEMEKNTTCQLKVNDLTADFSTLEDFDVSNFSKLNALGLADAAAGVMKFAPKFEILPMPLSAQDTLGGDDGKADMESQATENRLRNKFARFGQKLGLRRFSIDATNDENVTVQPSATSLPVESPRVELQKQPSSTRALDEPDSKQEPAAKSAGDENSTSDLR